ncbi:30S ribosomal protein S4 [Candidatus Woesearchaeota archaeon]|nr:30S ribosomal protein S4 [Candidatus Woesearchaeota archaeon]
MGDPRKHRKKYASPSHPWQKERIVEEQALCKEYGIVTKKEIWKANSILRDIAHQSKKLIAARGVQADREKAQLIKRASRLGFVSENATLDDLLGLTLKNILDRRLQTIVFRKGIAKSAKQARQFITHNHIKVGDNVVTSPGSIVPKGFEPLVRVRENSVLADENHPERAVAPSAESVAEDAKKKDAEKAQSGKAEKKVDEKHRDGKKRDEKKAREKRSSEKSGSEMKGSEKSGSETKSEEGKKDEIHDSEKKAGDE